ncbi:MAG: 23S rRNA (cytosine1962-C5)-methyltransferase [Candidatus Peregrinibacteria bacterium Greene1014_49]|nr:MAG: 23S rRNA (cytosine1962-C5)-methyltransferase [Candidatus Peregrinibacteria bacterium Greene1014_49]
MAYPVLTLKPSADVHLRNRHHAVFRTAVDRLPTCTDGDIVEVRSSKGEFLCYATWNSKAYICGRAIAFEEGDPMKILRTLIEKAVSLRIQFFSREDTTAYRLINAEGDGIPGLIVDRYGSVLAIQFTTLGMDRLRSWVIEVLREFCKPSGIFEKSGGSARKKEGLEEKEGWIWGSGDASIPVTERGMQFLITLSGSQKTGLFLDQREMRSLVRTVAKDRTVLDCCSYVGGFSLAALLGGAVAADAVDYDAEALATAATHMAMNGVESNRFSSYTEDVFNFLRRKPYPHTYDFIILDPPAFAKRSADLEPAKKAYTDLNRLAMQALPSGGLLLTCSCSYQMDTETFQTMIFNAARQAKRSVRILQRHRQAIDHPINLFHPETEYLKSLLLWVE